MVKELTKNRIACPLWNGASELELLADTVRFDNKANVYKCKETGLVFLDQNSFEFPDDFYESDYHQTYITHIEPDALNPDVYFEKMKKACKIWSDEFKEILKGDECVLDVGCSTGHFMTLIKENVSEVYGHEIAKKEIQFCQEKLDLNVSNEPFAQRFSKGQFDYITMIFVLEHIADPATV